MRWFPILLIAMLAGCVDSDGSDQTSTPIGEVPSDFEEDVAGSIGLIGTFYTEDCIATYCVDAVATNEGSEDYYVSNICVTPWRESMSRSGSSVEKTEPMFHCEAFGTGPFAAGESMSATFSWDGKLWDDATQSYQSAPPGTYAWNTHFRAYEEPDGGNPVDLQVTFDVTIA